MKDHIMTLKPELIMLKIKKNTNLLILQDHILRPLILPNTY